MIAEMSRRRGKEKEGDRGREREREQEAMDDDAWKGKIRERAKSGPELYSGKNKQKSTQIAKS